MKNAKKPGHSMDYTNASGATIESGSPVVVGDKVFIACGKILDGEQGVLATCGVFEVAKDAPLVIGQGVTLYYDAADGEVKIDDEAGANLKIGYAHEAAVSAATTVLVTLE